ncbi:MAG: hypothetical protein AAF750_09995 [Planctomycetota bacterium]
MSAALITRLAPAKLNLSLRVSPPRPDGLHPIDSRFTVTSLHDTLTAEPLNQAPPGHPASAGWLSPTLHYIRETAPDAPTPIPLDWPLQDDLVTRAHALLEHLANKPLPSRIHLTKRIPAGTGLGGGSSNAAAALHALSDLHQLTDLLQTLTPQTIAQHLGADTAFFHRYQLDPTNPQHHTAHITGIGDQLNPLTPQQTAKLPTHAVLIFPPVHANTAAVYRAFDQPHPRITPPRSPRIPTVGPNDLFPPARHLYPDLDRAFTALQHANLAPHLSGSGSTLFLPTYNLPNANQLQQQAQAAANLPTQLVTLTPPHPTRAV